MKHLPGSGTCRFTTLIIVSLVWFVTGCARVPIPTQDQTTTPTPLATLVPSLVGSAVTETPPPTETATLAPTATMTGISSAAARIPTARATKRPAAITTPVAYDKSPRAILLEADISGGLAPVPPEAHVPLFRLYGDGFLVFAGEDKPLASGLDAVVHTARLTEPQIQELFASVRDMGFYDLEPFYQPRPVPSDLPTAHITINVNRSKTVSVYAPGSGADPPAFFDTFGHILRSIPNTSQSIVPTEGYLQSVAAGSVTHFKSKDIIAEWPTNLGIRLSDSTDGVIISGSQYTSVVAVVAKVFPNTLYREGDSVYRVSFAPELPRAVHLTDWVGPILQAPREFEGRTFDIIGYFRGYNLLGEARGNPPVTRSDWVIADSSGAMYVTGSLPQGLEPQSRADAWSIVRLRAVVVYVRSGTSHLQARSVQVQSRSATATTSTPAVTATSILTPTTPFMPSASPSSVLTRTPTATITLTSVLSAPATLQPTRAPTRVELR